MGHKLFRTFHPSTGRLPEWRHRLDGLLHRQPILLLATSSACGILLDSMLSKSGGPLTSPLRAGLWVGLTLILVGSVLLRPRGKSVVVAVLLGIPLAAGLHSLRELSYQDSEILQVSGSAERSAVLEGVIDRPAVLRRHPLARRRQGHGESMRLTGLEVTVTRLRYGRRMQPCSGRVVVIVDGDCSHRRPGDVVRIYGKLSGFTGATNPGEIDYRTVYRQQHLHARVQCDSVDQILLLDSHPSWSQRVLALIAEIGAKGRDLLMEQLGEKPGSLAAALVMGQREFVDESTRDLLLVTGTAHLLSVSGLHLAIVVGVAAWIATLARFPLSLKIVWIVIICVFYTAITGARPPVVRAAILIGTLMVSLWMRRTGQPVNTLSLAAILLMAINPLLLFNVGVQLSFLAVITLLTCHRGSRTRAELLDDAVRREERLRALLDATRSRLSRLFRAGGRRLSQAIWFSGCVTAITGPLVWYQFHVVSPISVGTNVMMGPFLFVALASGVTAVAAGLVFEPLAMVPAYVCGLSIRSMQWIIEWAASVPGGHHWLPAPPGWWVAVFYIVVGASMWTAGNRWSSTFRYAWMVVWVAFAWLMATRQPPLAPGHLEAIFVDVGHGTCVVLRPGGDQVWLYDCGRLGNETYNSRHIDSVLWSLGATRISGIFLSHADTDHFNALPGILRRFDVAGVYAPDRLLEGAEPALEAVRQRVAEEQLSVVEIADGSTLPVGDHVAHVLHPPRGGITGSDNANSLVLRLDIGSCPIVLPGDLESPGTHFLIQADRPRPGGVLMAPHHGALNVDSSAILQWSRPSVTIVSGGRRADRPEVVEMLSEKGSTVHVTSQVGAIRVQIDPGGRVRIQHWKESPW